MLMGIIEKLLISTPRSGDIAWDRVGLIYKFLHFAHIHNNFQESKKFLEIFPVISHLSIVNKLPQCLN
jgi:hypothetical protein